MTRYRSSHPSRCLWSALALSAALAGTAGATSPTLRWSDPALPGRALRVPIGGGLRIEGAVLEPGGTPEAFELERFRVFAPDAQVVVHGKDETRTLPPPAHAYFRGTVTGRAGSRVMLTALEDGGLRGLIAADGRYWLAIQGAGDSQPTLQEVTDHPALTAGARPFVCGTDQLVRPAAETPPEPWTAEAIPHGSPSRQGASYTVRMAVETDYEYYQLFGSTSAALTYAGDLFGYASSYFTTEVNTDFWVSYVSLWTTAADPWTQTSSGCGLFEFARYWNASMTQVTRTVAHFLSGKTAGGGMSWPGTLCSSPFYFSISGWGCSLTPTYDLYGGGYGFSGSLTGSFQISNPVVVLDIYEVSHEVGHHFHSNTISGHTHCYVPEIDQCWNQEQGCYSGTPSLPGPSGQGSGTIMSYCHMIPPYYSNISLTFGLAHPWGNQPQRVPAVMNAYVASVAASSPLCLLTMFADGFESGDSSAWSSTVP